MTLDYLETLTFLLETYADICGHRLSLLCSLAADPTADILTHRS